MAKRLTCLLLDANIIIHAFELGLWDHLVERCDIHVASIIVGEAQFYRGPDGEDRPLDLRGYIERSAIQQFSVELSHIERFSNKFGPVYLDKLDPGEAESLCYLLGLSYEWRFCSADKIVYRILGASSRGDQGISLEEILNQLGLSRQLDHQYGRRYREQWTTKGFQEGLTGIGLNT
jgi:hypothetical protein